MYFREPVTADESRPLWDENPVDYFRRSTKPEARAVREFLNRTLAHFPPKDARSYVGKLRQDWQSFYFEIIVGRYLQVLGADIELNAKYLNETDVDFRAKFPDGVVVSVECVSKRYNDAARRELQRHGNMTNMLAEVGRHGWAINCNMWPRSTSAAEFQPYVDAAAEFYARLPEPVDGGPPIPFEWMGDQGGFSLEAIPSPRAAAPFHFGAGVGFMDNSIQRLKHALIDSHKRRQAQGAFPPVFLAIDCPFNGPEVEDFDQALFGQAVDHRGFDPHESVGVSFDPNGIFVTDRGIPFAGVIAFLGMRMTEAADPVVYLNPYQRWQLPIALAAHEQRVWTSHIDRIPATRKPVINSLGFIRYPDREL